MTAAMTGPSPQAVEWLRKLVGFATVSGSESNLGLLEVARAALEVAGFTARFTRSGDGQRANLFATRGAGPGGLLLSGHTDVVSAEGQQWSRPPFQMTEDAQRFYGRGTCDMKGFLAAVLAVATRAECLAPERPLHVALTYDEEIGCLGVRPMLADLAEAGIRPGACIIGEPTQMRVVRAHKGRHSYRCRVTGHATHSSLSGTGVNAAEVACAMVTQVAQLAAAVKQSEHDAGFAVPHSTLATCRIAAGHASNVIPESAEFDFDLRYLPATDPEAVIDPIRRAVAAAQARMREHVVPSRVVLECRTSVPALAHSAAAERIAAAALRAGAKNGLPASYTTEGGLYQAAGIPTIICGPGSIEQAHTADEFILKSELAACETFLENLLGARALSPAAHA
ncbi:acetylornithine deacetylase [Variovorax sp. CF079]|uniref:acetylornithine deacetylase n=1 Tax=Variovorax sp. CF079 TaxID=1882774 RepID=UPI000880D48E|nr:acetylornithine deacetylase [Variovorax sp. CF079]SDE73210.1 acetylornithine deacetylase [Variovorax sp. CF079]